MDDEPGQLVNLAQERERLEQRLRNRRRTGGDLTPAWMIRMHNLHGGEHHNANHDTGHQPPSELRLGIIFCGIAVFFTIVFVGPSIGEAGETHGVAGIAGCFFIMSLFLIWVHLRSTRT